MEEAPWRKALSTLRSFSKEPDVRDAAEVNVGDTGGLQRDAWRVDDIRTTLPEDAHLSKDANLSGNAHDHDKGRQSGEDVDWLVGNHAAMMHGSPSLVETLGGYGSDASPITSPYNAVPIVQNRSHDRMDHTRFSSLRGAVTAYDSVKHAVESQGDGAGVLRPPAAVMPSMEAFFSKSRCNRMRKDFQSESGEIIHGDVSQCRLDGDSRDTFVFGGDGHIIYDPMHANGTSVDTKASKKLPQYNNKAVRKLSLCVAARDAAGATEDQPNMSGHDDTLGKPGSRTSLGTSSPAYSPPLELSSYLSEHLCDMYYKDGMPRTMYEWQATCLTLHEGILNNQKNLVVSAPTSSGKTLIAEILMLRAVANDARGRKVLFILPYVALCDEKAKKLSKLLIPMGRELKRAYGSEYSDDILNKKTGIIVCTPENANSIVNRMIDANVPITGEICCVVVDELHLVGKDDRGTLMEILISKLKFHADLETDIARNTQTDPSRYSSPLGSRGSIDQCFIQFIGLTATLPNIENIGKWLDAITYSDTFRPVPLNEHLKIGNELFVRDNHTSELQMVRTLAPPHALDPDHIGYLTKEAVDAAKSVMIFCASKNGCKIEAERLSKYFQSCLENKNTLVMEEIVDARSEIASKLSRNEYTYSKALSNLVRQGIAFHHGDLSMEERKIIEDAVRQGYIQVLCATSTLGTGVNLPIYRVIFRDAYQGQMIPRNFIRPDIYRQISGRAGRTGIDTCGESFLIYRSQSGSPPKSYLTGLILGDLSKVESSMSTLQANKINRFVLETVATATVPVDKIVMDKILQSSLLYCSSTETLGKDSSRELIYKAVNTSLLYLSENHSKKDSSGKRTRKQGIDDEPLLRKEFLGPHTRIVYKPTNLGKAIVVSGMDPEEALLYLKDLSAALTYGFIMGSPLHAAYLCVPMNFMQLHMGKEEYEILYKRVQMSDEVESQVLNRISLDMAFLTQCKTFGPYRSEHIKKQPNLEIQARICTRIYIAYLFEDLINGMSTFECMERYRIRSGRTMEDLRDDVCRFAAKGSALCERLKKDLLGATLRNFGSQVWFGMREEIIKLATICKIKPKEAMILYNSGIETPNKILEKSAEEISTVLLHGSKEADVDVNKTYLGVLEGAAARIIDACRSHVSKLQVEPFDERFQKGKSPSIKSQFASKKMSDKAPTIPGYTSSDNGSDKGHSKPTESTPHCIGHKSKPGILKQSDTEQHKMAREAIMSGKPLGLYLNIENTDIMTKDLCKMPRNPAKKKFKHISDESNFVYPTGIAFSWDNGDEYIQLEGKEQHEMDLIIKQLADSFRSRNSLTEKGYIGVINWKRQYPIIKRIFKTDADEVGVALRSAIDIVIGTWMLDTDGFEKNVDHCYHSGVKHFKHARSSRSSLNVASDVGDDYKLSKVVQTFLNSGTMEKHYLRNESPEDMSQKEYKRNIFLTISRINLNCLEKIVNVVSKHGLLMPLLDIDMPICKILGEMEKQGLGFDQSFLLKLKPNLIKWKNNITRIAGQEIGKNGNLGSHIFVKDVIFKLYNYPMPRSALRHSPGKRTKVSVDKQTLNDIQKAHPENKFIPLVLKYRKIEDTIGTVDSLLGFGTCSGNASVPTLHAHFLQTSTATGRISMDNPNLQCIPKSFTLELGGETMDVNIRKSIIPKLSTRVILSADFRHIELRVMAHLSGDKSMIRILQDPESDPFKRLACEWLQVQDESMVTTEQRQHVKHLTYALLYGMGEMRLGQELNTSAAKAREMKRDFLLRFPDLSEWIERVVLGCREKHHIVTLCNHIRWLDDINSADSSKRAAHERAAVNSVCQGSAADIAKLAMIKVENSLQKRFNGKPPCYAVLQVHDELLFEVEKCFLKEVTLVIKDAMEHAYPLSVPLPVGFQQGRSWGEMMPFDPFSL